MIFSPLKAAQHIFRFLRGQVCLVGHLSIQDRRCWMTPGCLTRCRSLLMLGIKRLVAPSFWYAPVEIYLWIHSPVVLSNCICPISGLKGLLPKDGMNLLKDTRLTDALWDTHTCKKRLDKGIQTTPRYCKNKAANSQIEVDLKYHCCTKPHDSPEIEVPYNLVITPMSTSTSEYVETVIHENWSPAGPCWQLHIRRSSHSQFV